VIPGLTGSLLSHDVVAAEFLSDRGTLSRGAAGWRSRLESELGPASSARAVFDRLAVPLLESLGHTVIPLGEDVGAIHAQLVADGHTCGVLVVTPWGWDPAAVWNDSVRLGIACGIRWCFCITGPLLRVVDALRTYSRRYVQFDLDIARREPSTGAALRGLLASERLSATPVPALDRAVLASERFRAEVRACLQDGVLEALQALLSAFATARLGRPRTTRPAVLLEESLVVIYRMLFLLFAEARGLVPTWHPVFRESYTIESLREPLTRSGRPLGLWEALQAIARLAHDGCHAGTLRVPAFNGRLFSPLGAPLAESVRLDDAAVREAMLALTTRTSAHGRLPIAYADLGVEQLGGVYERILDYAPAAVEGDRGTLTLVRSGRRKATGTFYTPRTLTDFLVRRTLAPLVARATPTEILSLRIVDPAMGSGAFLVAACRYLASAYEAALLREDAISSFDVLESDRAGFRRLIAQRCLYGVDVNPMAVQLGRLSLWLATLAADRPLTFLDHHLLAGNSIAGASPTDIARQPPMRGRRPQATLPLFDVEMLDRIMQSVVAGRVSLAMDPGDTVAQVRAKEDLLRTLHAEPRLAAWKTISDLWCAEWFRDGRPLTSGMFGALLDGVLGRAGPRLPAGTAKSFLDECASVSHRERFFHWPLEFPEVFFDPDGRSLGSPGFDAVLGNPPWEMLRGDRGESSDAGRLTAFARESGVYRFQGRGHANLFQLFAERALALLKIGGRVGLILPSGFAIDHGCALLRGAFLDSTGIDTFVTVANHDGLFPVHRGLKFVLLTATRGMSTRTVPARAGIRTPVELERLPDGDDAGVVPIPRGLLREFSGDQNAIPELRTRTDLAILSRIVESVSAVTSERGWNVTFGRELNATDDRRHFVAGSRRANTCPVVEGKQISPFAVDLAASTHSIRRATAERLLGMRFKRPRLAYRDVASASNRLTLIAAILPAGTVSTHTVFCLKSPVDLDVQYFLCGVFNSFVANYLVRLRVNTHVTVAIIQRLPVPRPPRDSQPYAAIVELSRARSETRNDDDEARLQALVAWLYGCSTDEFRHILDSFPLVPAAERDHALDALVGIQGSHPPYTGLLR
jgi:Eco57I restriction-modification methylase